MNRILIVIAIGAAVWLGLGWTGMTKTVPGPDPRPAASGPGLAAQLDEAGDLALYGPGGMEAAEARARRHTRSE